ncbi:energy-coupling factor ABC transporter ATP-binding protein [Candidatus Poribacteria bacterium]|nr:energy-coupling factor ABC transporter ATP-binding protein [Candidatus Poribacteria bacterium]MYK16656.1 energy-coupling factor ABC transporter ATP-binding protein [Candidatus Poribacteria bacterium]
MASIEVENLGFTYPSRQIRTLRGITTRVLSGAFVLLTGPTGCGKSTLLRTLNGLIPHASAGTLTGRVLLKGKNLAAQPLATTCQQVALLFQDPEDQLFCTLVEDEIAFGLENLGFSSEEIQERIAIALEQVGLSDFQNREISSLSGGQKQRIALAAICAMQPQVLLLDEPTSHLDPQATRDILDIVAKLNKEMGITVILATHRTKEVAPLCDHVWLMDQGQLVLDLPRVEAFKDFSPYQRLGVQVPVDRETASDTQPSRRTTSIVSPSKNFSLSVNELYFRYPNTDTDAVQGISCEAQHGEVFAIMGANGSGKTTLIHLIAGLLRPSAGEVAIAGKLRKRMKLHQLAGEVGIVFQNPDLLLQAKTVRDEVAFGPKNLKFSRKTLEDRVNQTIRRFDLTDIDSEAPYALSRGQRQRTAVAANFSLRPNIFLLDEPTTGQDAQHLYQLMDELCDEIRRENKTLIFATHDTDLTLKYADRVLLLCDGQVIFDGAPDRAFNNPELLAQASL